MHAADLEVGGDDLEVGVDAAQVVLLQLHADVLRDEVDRHHVVAPAAGPKAVHNASCVWDDGLGLATTQHACQNQMNPPPPCTACPARLTQRRSGARG